jgi:hypothetical protein
MKALFQTPLPVAKYMCSLIPVGTVTILEPTCGNGNILSQLTDYKVTAPENYFELQRDRFDCIIMNPPFSMKYTYGVPDHYKKETGMKIGYRIFFECMEMSDNVIALMPWFLILDSTPRLNFLKSFGLKSITALPRSTFEYARIQCAIFELQKGFNGETIFKQFHFSKAKQTLIKF